MKWFKEKISSYNYKDYNLSILVIGIVLGVIGAYTLHLMPNYNDSYYLKHLVSIAGGVVFALFVSVFDYRFIAKFAIPLYILNLALLWAVKFTKYGIGRYGAIRWLGYKDAADNVIVSFQPSELTKVIMIIVMAKFFEIVKNKLDKWYIEFLAGIIFAIPLLFVLIEPDLSTSIVLFVCFAIMLFASGYNIKMIIGTVIIAIPLLIGTFWYVQQPDQKLLTNKQQERVLSFLHPEDYPDIIYQQANSVKAISSGGLLGKQLTGDESYRGTNSVPVAESDFIFAGIGEEFGFIGCLVVIGLFILLTFFTIKIAFKSKDILGRIIAIGAAAIYMAQCFVNIGVVTQILPNTGIPLPFVSSGLSSALSSYLLLGLVLNVSINQNLKDKDQLNFL